MLEWLVRLLMGYGIRLLDALAILSFIGILVVVGFLLLCRWWQARQKQLLSNLAEARQRIETQQQSLAEMQQHIDELQRDLAEARERYDPAQFRLLHDHLQHAITHEFGKGLNFIVTESEKTLGELREDQTDLKDRLAQVMAKAHELIQHARNVVGLFGLEREPFQRDMVNLRGVMEGVLKELFPYAEAQGVTLRPSYVSFGPVLANSHLVAQLFSNVVHNAIKYSPQGGVVDIVLRLEEDGEKRVCVQVRDRGRGIEEKDRERIFSLRTRGDGLVEPGSGLGLYYAQEIARMHGGDLTLVESQVNQGSMFKITLPYR
jgi:signal transduction histidine kinase